MLRDFISYYRPTSACSCLLDFSAAVGSGLAGAVIPAGDHR
ncbi:hypothetical protein PE067_14095 [Paracoccus sp. DMF-8]|nr:hypothetical protein [Paracoccus sp. DMF-8]MDF3607167.1 hypothetical protein [Paracoccus sp. DMF-8]